MSYDLMVFRTEAAPEDKKEFAAWYDQQTEWAEDLDYNDPENTSGALKSFFTEMQQAFPSLNGPDEIDDDDPKVTDYSIGNDVIYAAFAFSVAENANITMHSLAGKNKLGLYDPQSDAIFLPDGNGGLKNMNEAKKPWWKFW
jgi:hypothetical protein